MIRRGAETEGHPRPRNTKTRQGRASIPAEAGI
jgi:hypothetical protein